MRTQPLPHSTQLIEDFFPLPWLLWKEHAMLCMKTWIASLPRRLSFLQSAEDGHRGTHRGLLTAEGFTALLWTGLVRFDFVNLYSSPSSSISVSPCTGCLKHRLLKTNSRYSTVTLPDGAGNKGHPRPKTGKKRTDAL